MDWQRYCNQNIMASSPGSEFPNGMAEVYEHAAGLACEFDKIKQNCGSDSVDGLAPIIINMLEQLERFAYRYNQDQAEISVLRSNVERLEVEKADRAQERVKFEQEMEGIEENWQAEVNGLLSMVEKLQGENTRLKQALQNEKHAMEEKVSAKYRENEEQEIKVLTKLKETVDKQREELRLMRREHKQKAVDCEALQANVEMLTRINQDLHLKHTTHRKQMQVLLTEKVELEVALHHKDNEVEKVKVMIAEREKFDQQRAASRASVTADQRRSEEDPECEEENGELAEDGGTITVKSLAEETAAAVRKETAEKQNSDSTSAPALPDLAAELTHGQEGKMVIDLKDPNRPRFTLHELRQVLMERNELKARLIEVEEELSLYRPRNLNYSGEEMPVYGPINREPERFGPKESGIRKFFSFLFRDGTSPSQSPQQKSGIVTGK